MDKIKINSLLITISGIIVTLVIIYLFKEVDKTLPNYATVIGTVCSLIGFSLSYINILSLKKSAEVTNLKIEDTLQKVNQLNSVSEISKAIKTNQEIQNFIRNGKVELAHLRTLDLKYMLLHLNGNQHLNELTKNSNYQELVIEFGIDLNSINDYLITPKRKVDFSKVTKNLEDLSTFLTQFETKLKSVSYDTK